jgi:predicted dehydrogenase
MKIKSNIWLIGTGKMAIEYCKVLVALNVEFIVIGRSRSNCENFKKVTSIVPFQGGLLNFLASNPKIPEAVINASGIESLTTTTQQLLEYGVKYILLEKPGFGRPIELISTEKLVVTMGATVFLAYNRRFYSSVMRAQEIIRSDGGVKSLCFEFTEWSHYIIQLKKEQVELENWFYGNSSHLIDLAFYLAGMPIEISSYQKSNLSWHPSGSIFVGSGITENGALFSYCANWASPGRWGLELCTNNYRLIFRPIEKLAIMKIGSVQIDSDSELNDSLDISFKPGVYKQVESLLCKDYSRFITVSEHMASLKRFYSKINNRIAF